jgi:hypothetical protein
MKRNQSSKVEQISNSPALLAVTRHLLEHQILTITCRKHTWKVQRYPTLGTAVILGDVTLQFHKVFSRWRADYQLCPLQAHTVLRVACEHTMLHKTRYKGRIFRGLHIKLIILESWLRLWTLSIVSFSRSTTFVSLNCHSLQVKWEIGKYEQLVCHKEPPF